jgi:hypothetical protein
MSPTSRLGSPERLDRPALRRVDTKRVSLWEIHPVYAVDVCSGSTIADCPFDDDSKWHPLETKPAAPPPGK